MNSHTVSRRSALAGTDGIAATAATSTVSVPNPAAANAGFGVGGIHAIPDLAPHWKKLDLAEILSRPAAYMSVSQNKSLYESWGEMDPTGETTGVAG
jgi:hypothetical protein